MPFEQQHVRSRNITLSANKQTTYGTALGDGALTLRPPVMDETAFASLGKTFYDNMDRANKGHQWTTVRQKIQQATQFNTGTVDLSDAMAGWLFAFLMGADTISGAGPYTHLFKFLQSTNQMPVTTLYFEDTADVKYKMQDMAIAQLTLSGADKGPIQVSANLVGSGRYLDGAMVSPIAPTAPTILLASDTDILIGAPTAAASIKERIRQWSVKFTVGLVPNYAPGGGMFASFTKIDTQQVSLDLQIAAKDTDDVRTLFTNDTLQEVDINCNSGAAAQLMIKFPGLYLSSAQIGASGKEEVWSVSSDERSVTKQGSSEVVQVTVINSQPTYLVAA